MTPDHAVPQDRTKARPHVRAALSWLVGVALVQVVLTSANHLARSQTHLWGSSLSGYMDVRDGSAMTWTSGFPLAAGEVACDRTKWRVSFHPDVGRSGSERLECIPPPGASRISDIGRENFSVVALLANVLLTAIPLAIIALRSGGRYPLLVLPGFLLAAAVPTPEGPVGGVTKVVAWAGALALMPAIAAAWRRLRGVRHRMSIPTPGE
jgi:hypothetical protein